MNRTYFDKSETREPSRLIHERIVQGFSKALNYWSPLQPTLN